MHFHREMKKYPQYPHLLWSSVKYSWTGNHSISQKLSFSFESNASVHDVLYFFLSKFMKSVEFENWTLLFRALIALQSDWSGIHEVF